MGARDYFERVQSAARAREHAIETLERMRSSAELHTQTYSDAGTGRGDTDTIINLVAKERELSDVVAGYDAILDEASAILFGAHGRGGVAKCYGEPEAVAIHTIYCECGTVDEAAKRCECEPAWARHLCDRGFRWIDAHGLLSQYSRSPKT